MTFMFGVLGSGIFWTIFIIINFIMWALTLKKIAPWTYDFIINKDKSYYDLDDKTCYCTIIVITFIFWPLCYLGLLIKFIIETFLGPGFRKCFIFVINSMPEIQISKKEDNEE